MNEASFCNFSLFFCEVHIFTTSNYHQVLEKYLHGNG